MPRYTVFSDVHANAEALEAFLEHSRNQGTDVYFCCGDIVGYGADPVFCLEKIFEICPHQAIQGNHDHAALTGMTTNMNRYAKEAIKWTRNQLNSSHIEQLSSLPLTYEQGQEFLLVHASPESPELWKYIFGLLEAYQAFQSFSHRICWVGHTHSPSFIEYWPDGQMVRLSGNRIPLRENARYLVNVGSVGQPRDHDPRGSYVVYDSDQNFMEHYRFQYAVEKAQEKIRRAGLPPLLAIRLAEGF